MKICFTLDSFVTGGAERVAITLCNVFVSKGIDTNIILTSSKNISPCYELDPKVKIFTSTSDKRNGFFSRSKRLKKIITSINPDIVIGFLPNVCIYLWYSLRKTDIKVIMSERNDPSQMKPLYKFLLRYIFKKANGTVFQNKFAQNWYFKKPNETSAIIYNPVNLMETRYCVPNKKNKIVYVGRLIEQKNIDMLIKSFYRFTLKYNDTILKIYGTGLLKDELYDLCVAYGINDRVYFCGNDADWQKKEVDAKMFVLPSKREGMPNALEEALCLGIPSVCTNCPSGGSAILMEMFGLTKFLSKVNDENDFYNKMIDCYSNPHIDDNIVEQNREKLSKENIANEWIVFIKKVLEYE